MGALSAYPYMFPNGTKVYACGQPDNFRIGFADYERVPAENFYQVARKAYELGIRELFVPNPSTFDREVVDKSFFPYTDLVSEVRIRHGAIADGVMLDPGMAVAMITGDCPTITLVARKLVIVAHAGLASLLPRPFQRGNSVVDNMMKLVPEEWRPEARVLVSCHIGPKHFIYRMNDPKWGEKNRERRNLILEEYFGRGTRILPELYCEHIDLFQLIVAQFEKHGVKESQISDDGIDTAATNSGYHSLTRDRKASGRNVMIVRREK